MPKTKAAKPNLELKLAHLERRVKQLEELLVSLLSVEESPENEQKDEYFEQAVEVISNYEFVSTALIQRRLNIGVERATYLLDRLEEEGYVGPESISRLRRVLRSRKKRLQN